MKESAISMNQSMVRAYLDGSKSQTRRPVKVHWTKGKRVPPYEPYYTDVDGKLYVMNQYGDYNPIEKTTDAPVQVGDLFWIRERVRLVDKWECSEDHHQFRYEADNLLSDWIRIPDRIKPIKHYHCVPNGCFKELARIWPEVVGVGAERVQSISEEDCLAEGIRKVSKDGTVYKYCIYDHGDYSSVAWSDMPRNPIDVFKNLWDSIYGKTAYSWDNNPYVWKFTTKTISTTGRPEVK